MRSANKVDADLAANDVRLTMGGEPTFVSIDDYQSEEWNTAALGPNKRKRADDLIRRFYDRYGPGGLLHFGQGKWYPGEPLPRWALSLFWRRDGVPIWRDLSPDRARGAGHRTVAGRCAALRRGHCGATGNHGRVRAARIRGSGRPHAVAGGAVAENIDPSDPKIDDPQERARILRSFDTHLTQPAGFVLPVQRCIRARTSPAG